MRRRRGILIVGSRRDLRYVSSPWAPVVQRRAVVLGRAVTGERVELWSRTRGTRRTCLVLQYHVRLGADQTAAAIPHRAPRRLSAGALHRTSGSLCTIARRDGATDRGPCRDDRAGTGSGCHGRRPLPRRATRPRRCGSVRGQRAGLDRRSGGNAVIGGIDQTENPVPIPSPDRAPSLDAVMPGAITLSSMLAGLPSLEGGSATMVGYNHCPVPPGPGQQQRPRALRATTVRRSASDRAPDPDGRQARYWPRWRCHGRQQWRG